MDSQKALDQFAPAILKIYQHDKEGFWTAVLSSFLSDQFSIKNKWTQLKVGIRLLPALKKLDEGAKQVLQDFGSPLGLDINQWNSNRASYLKDAYPIFAFLAVWMHEEGLDDLLAEFGDILKAGIYAVAGYGILDVNVDGDHPAPVEILAAQALIAEYETLALRIFGITEVNLGIMHKMRTLYLSAEIKEKNLRGKASPYSLDRPQDCGTKGANAVTPYMLSLERLGRAAHVDDYWEVFLLFGAAIQMIDDWSDLEGDLAVGHYSYVTLGYEELIRQHSPQETARLLRAETAHVRKTYDLSKEMIERARAILARLNDRFLGRLVDVTELRLEAYFRKEMKLT